MKALFKKGNMNSIGRRFAGVAGKTVEYIESCVGIAEEPHIYVRFNDGTALDIEIESTPNLSAEWHHRVEGKLGDFEPFQRKIFE
jgi:hypothetical protein